MVRERRKRRRRRRRDSYNRRRGRRKRRGGFWQEREGERGMKLPEGEVWLVLAGCGADRLRSVCARLQHHQD